jgi:hypothetical protein
MPQRIYQNELNKSLHKNVLANLDGEMYPASIFGEMSTWPRVRQSISLFIYYVVISCWIPLVLIF